MNLRYTSKKLIVLWALALILTVVKVAGVYDINWWWIIGSIIFSFTTFTIGNRKI